MKILLLCEPRSGSTSLANWFFRQEFDTRYETTDPKSKWYLKNGLYSIKFKPNVHLVFKETFYHSHFSYEPYIKFCDKIIFLFRENFEQQSVSYDHAKNFGSWASYYTVDNKYVPKVENVEYLNLLKKEFKNFRSKYKEGTLTISYEDLYNRGKINKVKEYLGLEDLLTYKFPNGHKLGNTVENLNVKKLI